MTYQNEANEIVFYCPHCGNEMTVAAENSGKKGRCPKCKMVITIPIHTMNVPELFDPNTVFHQKKMSQLYKDFSDKHDADILAQLPQVMKISGIDFDVLAITLRTDLARSRGVVIGCAPFYNESVSGETYEYNRLSFLTQIGKITKHDMSTFVMRTMMVNMFSAYIGEDDMFNLSVIRRLENIDFDEFEEIVYELAKYGDRIEDALFGGDVH